MTEVVFGPPGQECLNLFFSLFLQTNSTAKLTFISEYELAPTEGYEFFFLERASTSRMRSLLLSSSVESSDFSNVKHLKVDFSNLPDVEQFQITKFIYKFANLDSATLFYFDPQSYYHVLDLFHNNPIIHLSICSGHSPHSAHELFELINCCQLNSLDIKKHDDFDEQCYLDFFLRKYKSGFWNSLEKLVFHDFTYAFVCTLIMEMRLPKLSTLKIYNLLWDGSEDNLVIVATRHDTVENLSLYITDWENDRCGAVIQLMSMFPNVNQSRY